MIKIMRIKIFHDSNKEQTCSLLSGKKDCQFLRTTRMGTTFVCNATDDEVFYSGDIELLRPSENCPVKEPLK